MATHRLCFVLCHAPVIVGVEALEHSRAHGRELGLRERAVAIGVRIRPIRALAAFAVLSPPLRTLRTFRRLNDAVIVGVEPCEHRRRPRQEFFARDVAVIVRIGAGQAAAAMTAMAATTSIAALRTHFFARQLAIIVRIEPRELRDARSIELGPCQHAVAIRIGLKDAVPAAGVFAAALRNRNTGKTCRQNCSTRRRQQNLTHVSCLLPAALEESASLPLALVLQHRLCGRSSRLRQSLSLGRSETKKTAGAREAPAAVFGLSAWGEGRAGPA